MMIQWSNRTISGDVTHYTDESPYDRQALMYSEENTLPLQELVMKLENNGCWATIAGDRAFYSVKDDKIVLPTKDSFETIEDYYDTIAFETAHSTGRETLE